MNSEAIRDALLLAMDQNGEAMARVVRAYHERRTPERDVLWLKLQAGKELNAMRLRLSRAVAQNERIERGVSREQFGRLLYETWQEMNHCSGLADCLSEALNGAPLPMDEMAAYKGFAPDPRWPAHTARVEGFEALASGSTPWVRQVLHAVNEGGDAAFHWAVAQLPPDDALLAHIVQVETQIADDELGHGPEEIAELAAATPSREEFEVAIAVIRQGGVLNVRQRNEQFGDPLSEAEVQTIERELLDGTITPLNLFRPLATHA